MSKVAFRYGLMAESLSAQAEKQGYTLNNAEQWEKTLDAIFRVWLEDIVTDSQYDKMLQRFQKHMIKDLTRIKEQKNE